MEGSREGGREGRRKRGNEERRKKHRRAKEGEVDSSAPTGTALLSHSIPAQ